MGRVVAGCGEKVLVCGGVRRLCRIGRRVCGVCRQGYHCQRLQTTVEVCGELVCCVPPGGKGVVVVMVVWKG